MKRCLLLSLTIAVLAGLAVANLAWAGDECRDGKCARCAKKDAGECRDGAACRHGCVHKGACSCKHGYACYPWHGYYYHAGWGVPVALAVPPTAENQTHWGWGVGNTRITPICPQFQHYPPAPGVYSRAGFLATPAQPTDTDQFGVYYVRAPW